MVGEGDWVEEGLVAVERVVEGVVAVGVALVEEGLLALEETLVKEGFVAGEGALVAERLGSTEGPSEDVGLVAVKGDLVEAFVQQDDFLWLVQSL